MLTLTDLFAGAGGSSTGALAVPGISIRVASNHWGLAIESHAANHPDAEHIQADLSQIDPRRFPRTDLLWASPSCFTAGHLVLTTRGQVPIEDVVVGDLVMTHECRWQPVTAVMVRVADTIVVAGGGHYGIECTAEHPFFVKPRPKVWRNHLRRYVRDESNTPAWKAAGDLADDDYLAVPTRFPHLEVPELEGPRSLEFDWDFWWMVGRWLGDGSVRYKEAPPVTTPPRPRTAYQAAGSPCVVCGQPANPCGNSPSRLASPYCSRTCKARAVAHNACDSRGDIHITCGDHEADALAKRLARVPLRWRRRKTDTATMFEATHIDLVRWLVSNFGKYAHGKQLPSWALSMDVGDRRALLDGYLSADGHTARMTTATSVSKRLLVGIRLLACSVGEAASLRAPSKRTAGTIEGRRVDMKPLYSVGWTTNPSLNHTRTFSDGDYRWFGVRSLRPGRRQAEVFNLSVAEDESYVVDGIVTHNCTHHSSAQGKKRIDLQQPDLFGDILPDEAAERSRATMWDVVRFSEFHRYQCVIVENVVEVAQWPPFQAWLMAMDSIGYAHRIVWLNSMHAQVFGAGAPQSRDRTYVVFWRRGNRAPELERVVSPRAVCSEHGEGESRQAFKPGSRTVWSKYRSQYVYICGVTGCQRIVEPLYRPADDAIDWTLAGERIGDKPLREFKDKKTGEVFVGPLAKKTMVRVYAGIEKYWLPLLVPVEARAARDAARPVDQPVRTMTSRNETGLIVPCGGTWRDKAASVDAPMATRTTRESDALAFVAELRGGGSKHRRVTDALSTVTASGNHHALVTAYYGNGTTKPSTEALSTVTTTDRHALLMRNNTPRGDPAQMTTPAKEYMRTLTTQGHQSLLCGGPTIDINDVLFRMLEPHEHAAAMDFPRDYVLKGNKREQTRQAGAAVTPPCARDLVGVVAESLGVAS